MKHQAVYALTVAVVAAMAAGCSTLSQSTTIYAGTGTNAAQLIVYIHNDGQLSAPKTIVVPTLSNLDTNTVSAVAHGAAAGMAGR